VGVPKKYGFFASFVIPGCAMLIAVFVFFGGSSRYYKLPPSGSAFTRFVRVFMKAAKNTQLGSKILFGLFLIVLGMLATIVGFFIPESTQGSALNVPVIVAISGMVFMGCGLIILIHYGGNASWIYSGAKQSFYVKAEYTHKDVTDAYQVARLLPYLALITMFWACYGQMNNNFGKLHMTYMYIS
jgi:MFS superfamily sulfate permease-like transporter